MLDVSTTVSSLLADESLRFAWLVNIADAIFLTDHERDLALSGTTYLSRGDILSVSPINRERGIRLQSYSVRLSAVEKPLAQTLGATNLTGRPCQVLLAFPDGTGTLAANRTISMYKGSFHSWTLSESETSASIDVKFTSPWSKPGLMKGRVTSSDNQQQFFPGDKFFDFAHEKRTNLGWGGKA